VRPAQRVLDVVAGLVGVPVQVVDTLVDHDERCVLEVVLPDGRPAVVKGDLVAERSAREARVLESAATAGVPVPVVIGRAPGPPAVLVLERVGGSWLSPDRSPRAWAATGAAVHRLHDLDLPDLGPFAGRAGWAAGLGEMVIQWAPRTRAAGLDGNVADATRAAVGRLVRLRPEAPPAVTLHGDCVPIHVRLSHNDEVVGLLDLGDACRGDPAWDLAVLTLRSPERLPAVLDGYGADADLRAWAARSWPVYRALRLIAEVGWLAEHDLDPAGAAREATSAAQALP
jgi:aminoglycoside phosphotransferase (APT) family kinase protein